ncbi:hypothetical protein HON86_00080, partial [Candidatus Woesearchaeota archaeon]|nr:hypothetical protein [Candidatus Woesearchaeota archaeon]
MELKKREKSSFLSYISHNFSGLLKKISNKRTKIAYKILKIFLILLIGIILGLLFAKFFGTLDNPSRTALNFLNLDGLRDEKFVVDGILAENIRIPFNWVIGQFSTKEKIYIDIDFENYNKLEYKRQQALELGVLLTSAEDYVPAKITHNNEEYNVKLRLKGDHLDHLETSKWSFRVKVKDDKSLFGMTVFSLQNPRTRIYINELIYLLTLKESGLISLRYDFVEIFINGENKGIYALEEHFAKELIENNNRRDGILLKFSEDLVWEEYAMRPSLPSGLHFDTLFQSSVIETFDNDEILEDPIKANQFNTAKNLLESFRLNQLKTHQVFDVESFADYFAIVTLLNAGHAIEVQNMRFYYNPITSLLEPIGFDGYVNPSNAQAAMLNYLPECVVLSQIDNKCSPKNNDFIELFFSDEIFLKAYIQSLNDISDPSYLDDLFKKINPELKKEMRIMYKDYPFTHIPEENIYRNQAQIKDMLNPVQALNAHLLEGISSDNKVVLSLGNINTLPLEIVSLDINGTIISLNSRKILQPWNIDGEVKYKQIEFYIPSGIQWKSEYSSELKLNYRIFGLEEIKSAPIVPWENFENNFVQEDFMLQTSNFSSFEMLEVNEDVKTISIKKGTWQIQEDLIIPTGYRLVAEGETNIDLINNAMILSHSRITFEGSLEKPIRIFSSDGTGQGISVLNSE